MILFAAEEGYFWTALIVAVGTAIGAVILKVESLYKVINDIRLTWFKETVSHDSATIARLEAHLTKCDREQDLLKAEQVKLFDDNNALLLDNESQYWWMKLSYGVSLRNASKLRAAGIAAEDPPELPERKPRKLQDSGFKDRTAKTGNDIMDVAISEVKKKIEEGGQN